MLPLIEDRVGWNPIDVFESLDFIYMPSRDAGAELEQLVEGLGAEPVFAIERFGTRVAMLRVSPEGPALLLAEHLEGDRPILIYRVADLEAAIAELEGRGAELGPRFEMPYGPGIEVLSRGPQRLAVYELTRPERGASITGRRDF
jgi:hypothetical protein